MSRRLGWYVSAPTALIFASSKAQAKAIASTLVDAKIHREVEPGVPAAKAVRS